MVSGRQALDQARRELREERKRLRELDRRLKTDSEELLRLDAARAGQLERLARARIGGAADGAEESDARFASMLAEREATRRQLESRLAELDDAVDDLDGERERLIELVETAAAALDEAEAATQSSLERDEHYLEQVEIAQETRRIAHFAAQKAEQSESERQEKGAAYERDPLFMYLWRRRFGTDAYRGRGLTRWLDRKVARHIGFDSARANYARLTELPVRLREHAQRMEAAAQEEFEELRRMDVEARARDGVTALAEELAAVKSRLDEQEKRSAQTREARKVTLTEMDRMDRGEDEAYSELVEYLRDRLEREDLQTLRRQALATPLPEDDEVVSRLEDLEARHDRTSESVADLRRAAEASRQRVRELDEFVREFSQRHMDAPGTGFPDGELVEAMLGQFLRGAIASHVLWRVLEGQRRGPSRSSRPDFGSGGFGRGTPWGGGDWPFPSPGGGTGRSPVFPRPSGGMKRGSFTTGGRMRRGGFKTGRRR